MGTGFFPWEKAERGVKLTTYPKLTSMLPMSGITHIPPLCAFFAWTSQGKFKGKFHLRTDHAGPEGE
jgi:hypothetical protein